MSRRTRRAVQPPAPAAAVPQSPKIVSNPIFRCEAGPSREPSNPPPDQLRCVYRPGSLYALVHDPAAGSGGSGSGSGIGKPLPLPPCRAHRAGASGTGSRAPASRSGPVIVAGGTHGSRVHRRRAPHEHDPFLAAYVACSKSAGGKKGADATDRSQQKRKQGKKTKTKKATKNKRGKEGGCGIWAAGAKCAGAMSCRSYGCAVADQEQQQGDVPAAAAKAKSSEAGDDAVPAGLTLDLSWAPAVLSARARERRREQR